MCLYGTLPVELLAMQSCSQGHPHDRQLVANRFHCAVKLLRSYTSDEDGCRAQLRCQKQWWQRQRTR